MTSLSLGSIVFARLMEKGYGKQKALAISTAVDDTEIEVAAKFSLSVQSINKTDGNDILIGGFGKDTLIGGSGNDIYKADKFDTIIDSDKKVA